VLTTIKTGSLLPLDDESADKVMCTLWLRTNFKDPHLRVFFWEAINQYNKNIRRSMLISG